MYVPKNPSEPESEPNGMTCGRPAVGYQDLSGQTVELPAYKLPDMEYVGTQSFMVPQAAPP